MSRGEYFTARMMAEYLDMPFLDAADVIVFHHDGTLDKESTAQRLRAAAQECAGRFVMPGFYGATEDGQIKLFDRGGGDISGAVVARCLGADLYENWTDVSGFLTADPRIVDDPLPIPHVTYAELRELSYMGASVLHEDAVFPVKEAGIPLVIKNTNRPEDPGTVISAADDGESRQIAGVTGRRGFVALRVKQARGASAASALRAVLGVVERYRAPVERVSTGLSSCTLLFEEAAVKEYLYSLVAAIEQEAAPEGMDVVEHLALVSTVGRALPERPELTGRLFDALGSAGIDAPFASRNPGEIERDRRRGRAGLRRRHPRHLRGVRPLAGVRDGVRRRAGERAERGGRAPCRPPARGVRDRGHRIGQVERRAPSGAAGRARL